MKYLGLDSARRFSAIRTAALVVCLFASMACAAQVKKPHQWTQFVHVEGQPEPVPVEWISTVEGKLAHSIKIPNPVARNTGYRRGMSAKDYFEHLCKQDAGEFVFKTVERVEGFAFIRPSKKPTDSELVDRFRLEAPNIERMFQLYGSTTADRSTIFVVPGVRLYRYIEESDPERRGFEVAFGYETGSVRPKRSEYLQNRKSRYGLTWRGIKRQNDRENAIAGDEWIVIDLTTNEVLGVFRNYVRTGEARNSREGIWWLNAIQCPSSRNLVSAGHLGQQLYAFVEKVLRPNVEVAK